MKELRPFKEVQLQWLRLLLLDTELSARAFQFATYLAVRRYNGKHGKAWPSHSRVCEDLGLTNEKTIQRLIKELDGKWFDIKRGNGLKHSTEYVPTKETHLAAQKLREQEEAEKPDNIVRLPSAKGRHSCPKTRTNLSTEPRQECLPKKEQEKTKEKGTYATDLPNGRQSGGNTACGEGLVFVPRSICFVQYWDQQLAKEGLDSLERSLPQSPHRQHLGFWLPAQMPAPLGSPEWQEQLVWLRAQVNVDDPKWERRHAR